MSKWPLDRNKVTKLIMKITNNHYKTSRIYLILTQMINRILYNKHNHKSIKKTNNNGRITNKISYK